MRSAYGPRNARRRVLIIVQNLPVPFDRRVWLECGTLTEAGYDVTVICPQGRGTGAHQVIEGVTILGYPPYAPGGGAAAYIGEYAYSFVATAGLVLLARRSGPFVVMQACNPPDIFWPIARILRAIDGTRFVFDHHDLCPELFESRFAGRGMAWRGLVALERKTFRAADRVTSTNESYADVALTRGAKKRTDVRVVRTGPDLRRLRPVAADPELRRGRAHLAAYIGVMGPQDGVDIVIDAVDVLVHQLGRQDISFTLLGAGDCWKDLVARRDRLGLTEYIDMPGRVPDDTVAAVMSSADIGLSPDPKNPLNDLSTMNKTMEYMAFRLPVVAFDLRETRVSAGEAARYVIPNDVELYARAIADLIDDEAERKRMGQAGFQRVSGELAWCHQAGAYRSVFDELTGQAAGG